MQRGTLGEIGEEPLEKLESARWKMALCSRPEGIVDFWA